MIISASRRTDIPAFYSEWFLNRIRAGYCATVNPFNSRQVSRVDLSPHAVEVIVFWTRNAKPLLRYLDELDALGYHYYFQYTVTGYPPALEPRSPSLDQTVATIRHLSRRLSRHHVVWRYDPVVLSGITDVNFHRRHFAHLAAALSEFCGRVVLSIVDEYRAAKARLARAHDAGVVSPPESAPGFGEMVADLARIAQAEGLQIESCAERIDLRSYGIPPGKCIDDMLIHRLFGIDVTHQKDPNQREECGCVKSRDIGAYDTCPYGCVYCYATKSLSSSATKRQQHDPDSPSLVGWLEPEGTKTKKQEGQLPLL